MELAAPPGPHRGRGLTMAAVSFVYTIARMLGEDEERLHDLAPHLEPEDGRLWVYGTGDDATLAFTRDGVERLRELIAGEER